MGDPRWWCWLALALTACAKGGRLPSGGSGEVPAETRSTRVVGPEGASDSPLAALDRAARAVCGYRAVFFAAQEYADARIGSLKTPLEDARRIAFVLRNQYGFDTEIVGNPTRSQLLGAVGELVRTARPCEGIVIYYAGHGVRTDDGRALWLPVDATDGDVSTYVDTAEVTSLMAEVPADHMLLIADSCYAGNILSAAPTPPLGDAVPRSRWVLTSGADEPVVDEFLNENTSVFAYYLHQELSEAAAPLVAPLRLFSPLSKQVAAVTRGAQRPLYGPLPQAGDQGGHLVLRNRTTRDEDVVLPPESTLLGVHPFEPIDVWTPRKQNLLVVTTGFGLAGYSDPGSGDVESGPLVPTQRFDTFVDASLRLATGSLPGLHGEVSVGLGVQSGVPPFLDDVASGGARTQLLLRAPIRIAVPIRLSRSLETFIGPLVAEGYLGPSPGRGLEPGLGLGVSPGGLGFRAGKAGWFRWMPSTLLLRVGRTSSLAAGAPVTNAWHTSLSWSPDPGQPRRAAP